MLTLRADYLDAALRHTGLAGPLGRGSYVLGAMTPEQIAEAVTGPVERVRGVNFEPGLAKRIVADAGSDSGVLSLLGNTLTLLWQRQRRGVVTHQAYDELGQLSGSSSSAQRRPGTHLKSCTSHRICTRSSSGIALPAVRVLDLGGLRSGTCSPVRLVFWRIASTI